MANKLLEYILWRQGTGGSGSYEEKTVGPSSALHIEDALKKPAVSLIASMSPIQAGSGDPSPDNIRPITGRTGVTVERTGANLLDLPYAMDGATLTYNVNRLSVGYENGVLSATILTSESGSRDIDIALSESHRFTLANVISGYFTLSFNHSGMIPNSSNLFRARLIFTDNTGVFGNATFNDSRFVMTVSNMASFAGKTIKSIDIFAVYNAYADEGHAVKIWNLQLEYSTTNVGATDYEPRTGESYPVVFPDGQAVYGCTVDVVTGEGSIEWVGLTLDGVNKALNVASTSYIGATTTRGYITNSPYNSKSGVSNMEAWSMCSAAKFVGSVQETGVQSFQIAPNSVEINFRILNSLTGVTSADTTAEARTKINAYLAENPITVVYAVKDPIPFTLTPTQIQMLKVRNFMWSDADTLTLTYLAKKETQSLGNSAPLLFGGLNLGNALNDTNHETPQETVVDSVDGDPNEEE